MVTDTTTPPSVDWRMKLIFTGTGTSEGVPRLSCLTTKDSQVCKACTDAMTPGSKNRRRNTGCVLTEFEGVSEGGCVVIDCGKLWWEAALELFPKHNICKLDALIISHAHADAYLALDSMRDFCLNVPGQDSISMWVEAREFEQINQSFPYLFDRSKASGSFQLPAFDVKLFEPLKPFKAGTLPVTPFGMYHGSTSAASICMCYGFRLGKSCLWMSDVVGLPEESWQFIESLFPVDTLIVDCVAVEGHFPSHFYLAQTIEFIKKVMPRRAFLIGMWHGMEHHATNADLLEVSAACGVDIQLAYDGMVLDII